MYLLKRMIQKNIPSLNTNDNKKQTKIEKHKNININKTNKQNKSVKREGVNCSPFFTLLFMLYHTNIYDTQTPSYEYTI